MCMEDVRLGRETASVETLKVVGTVATQICGGSMDRTCLILPSLLVGNVTYKTSADIVSGAGFVLSAGQQPLILDVRYQGELVCKAWWAITDTAAATVWVTESLLKKQ